jgi:molybdopterin molybdotransferase
MKTAMQSSNFATAPFAAELQGANPRALHFEQAAALLLRLAQPVAQTERVPLQHAPGRILSADIIAPVSVPPCDNSAMDGFAFAGAQLRAGAPLALKLVGCALAGQPWTGQAAAGECVKIMTGAPMPAALDTVIAVEHALVNGTQITVPADAVKPGANCRLAGEDLMQGQIALRAGTRIDPAALGLLASLGLLHASVWRRPRVACFSTGNELLAPGQPWREGAIYDSNRPILLNLLTRLGCAAIDLGIVRDDPAQLQAAFAHAAQQADVVITSGGVSAGEADHTQTAMARLGEAAALRIHMRPGRPLAVGRIAAAGHDQPAATAPALLLGLPGNPVAAMVAFLMLVRPALLRIMGAHAAAQTPPLLIAARAACAMRKKPGRTEFQRGILSADAQGGLQVRGAGSQSSGALSVMARANALIVLPHNQGDVAAGDTVRVLPLDGLV